MVHVPPPHSLRRASSRLTRRAVVAGALGSIAAGSLIGCSSDQQTGTKPPPSRALTPDVTVATRALAEIRAVRVAAVMTLARFPESRSTLAPLVRAHRAHEATLVDAVPAGASTAARPARFVVPRRHGRALSKLAARERHLHETLDGLALRAQSGQFARLLASMGAALDQRLAGWPG